MKNDFRPGFLEMALQPCEIANVVESRIQDCPDVCHLEKAWLGNGRKSNPVDFCSKRLEK